jgi:hypothetical protein
VATPETAVQLEPELVTVALVVAVVTLLPHLMVALPELLALMKALTVPQVQRVRVQSVQLAQAVRQQ